MRFPRTQFAVLRATAALVIGLAALPSHAVPVMDMHAEDLLPMAADFKKTLNLNANQQTLWSQTESRTRQLLRERQSRRERLQASAKAITEGKNVELRDMAGALDAETTATAAEEKQLREWWLNVNDALTEPQRQLVVQLVAEQLLRVQDAGGRSGGESRPKESGDRSGGGRHKGGMGGGVGGGPGGASISLPGG